MTSGSNGHGAPPAGEQTQADHIWQQRRIDVFSTLLAAGFREFQRWAEEECPVKGQPGDAMTLQAVQHGLHLLAYQTGRPYERSRRPITAKMLAEALGELAAWAESGCGIMNPTNTEAEFLLHLGSHLDALGDILGIRKRIADAMHAAST